jgi:hypothetical protein
MDADQQKIIPDPQHMSLTLKGWVVGGYLENGVRIDVVVSRVSAPVLNVLAFPNLTYNTD